MHPATTWERKSESSKVRQHEDIWGTRRAVAAEQDDKGRRFIIFFSFADFSYYKVMLRSTKTTPTTFFLYLKFCEYTGILYRNQKCTYFLTSFYYIDTNPV